MNINEEAAQKLFDDGWVTCAEGHWTELQDDTGNCPTCQRPQIGSVEQLLTAMP